MVTRLLVAQLELERFAPIPRGVKLSSVFKIRGVVYGHRLSLCVYDIHRKNAV